MVRKASARFCKGRRRIVRCNEMRGFAVPAVNVSEIRVADANGFFQHGGKDRLKFAGRA